MGEEEVKKSDVLWGLGVPTRLMLALCFLKFTLSFLGFALC